MGFLLSPFSPSAEFSTSGLNPCSPCLPPEVRLGLASVLLQLPSGLGDIAKAYGGL